MFAAIASAHGQIEGRLVSAPAVAAKTLDLLKPKEEIATGDHERRVVAMEGNVLAYLQPNTKIAFSESSELRVLEGEVLLEVPLRKEEFRLVAADRVARLREGSVLVRFRDGPPAVHVMRDSGWGMAGPVSRIEGTGTPASAEDAVMRAGNA